MKHIPLAGSDITKYVRECIKDRGEQFKAEDGTEIAVKIKEKYGYVCTDVLKEYKKYGKKKVLDDGTVS